MRSLFAYVAVRRNDDTGATMVEYSIMVVLIAAVSVVVITNLGQDVFNLFNDASNLIN